MTTPKEMFTERVWKGWLDWTGYNATEMPLEYCQESLLQKSLSYDAKTMIQYMDAWTHGYDHALKDILKL